MGTGLVEQVTTVSTHHSGHFNAGIAIRGLNTQRRIRRMRRVVITAAEAARAALGDRNACDVVMVTLTYRPGVAWRPNQIGDYVRAVRLWLKHCAPSWKLRHQWVIELTKAGAPHYHVLWWGPIGFRLPMPDKSGHWTNGLTRVERARNPVGYLVKYATKGETQFFELPKGARLFGVGGGGEAEKLATHRAGLPMWLLERITDTARAGRVARIGWVDRDTGEIFRSPYVFRWFRDEFGFVVIEIVRSDHDASGDQVGGV